MPKVEFDVPVPIPVTTPVATDKDILNDIMDNSDTNSPDSLITVTERIVPQEEEVFSDSPAVKPIVDDEDESSEYIDPNKKGKRAYNRKQPMSSKQKDHLARIRLIAQEKRAKEKDRKANEKEEAQLKKVEERLLKKKQKEEDDALNEQEPAPPAAQPKKHSIPVSNQPYQKMYTEEDLNRAILAGVSTYDTFRRQEKKERKAKEAVDAKQRKMNETISRAVQPQNASNDPWRSLFG